MISKPERNRRMVASFLTDDQIGLFDLIGVTGLTTVEVKTALKSLINSGDAFDTGFGYVSLAPKL